MASKSKVRSAPAKVATSGGLLGRVKAMWAPISAGVIVLGALATYTAAPDTFVKFWQQFFGARLEGTWCMLDEVTGPQGHPSVGNTSGFIITITRKEANLYTARGIKVSSNGAAARTPSTLVLEEFSLDGDNHTRAHFEEDMHAGSRTFRGFFDWTYADAALAGTYLLSAGGIEGESRLERANDPNCRHLVTQTGPA
jgi:hypothetical protein